MLGELWAELTGAPHVLHVPIPWGVWMIGGFLGAAAVAWIMRLRKAEQRPPAEGDH